MLTKNLASSDLIKQKQSKTIYLNYITQQQTANQGCSQRVQIQGGSGADGSSSQLLFLVEGALFTSVTEQQTQLTNNLCLSFFAGVPSAPTNVYGLFGNTQITVFWSVPTFDGNSPILSYKVTSSPGGFTSTSTTTSAIVTGLTNGTAYTFTVIATNAIGNSVASSSSAAVTPSDIIPTNLALNLDASNTLSYSGSGSTWTDLSTAANNGNIQYATYVASPIKSFSFTKSTPSGTSTRISLSKNNIGNDFTISAWINTINVGSGNTHLTIMWIVGAETSGTPVTSPGDFGFGINNAGKLLFGCSPNDGTSALSTDAVNTGLWTNVVMTRNIATGNVIFYINGVASGSGTCPGGQTLNLIAPSIGFPGGIEPGFSFGGLIGGVLFYTSVLSSVDVLYNYNSLKSKYGL